MTSSPMTAARSQDLLDLLAQVPDPRKRRGRRHPLAGLLAVGIEMRRYIGLDILARSRHDAASTNQSEEVTLTAIHRIKSRTKITRRPAPQTPPPRT
jgi:hypothetical protein